MTKCQYCDQPATRYLSELGEAFVCDSEDCYWQGADDLCTMRPDVLTMDDYMSLGNVQDILSP